MESKYKLNKFDLFFYNFKFAYAYRYLDFVAMSLCGLQEKGDPSDEEFERHAIKYKDVSIFAILFSNN